MSTPYAAAVTAAAYHQPTLDDVLTAYALDAVNTGPADFTEDDLVRVTSDRADAVAGLWLKPPVLDVRRVAAACRTPLDSAMAATLIRNTELYFDQLSVIDRAFVALLKPHEPVPGHRCQPCDSLWPCAPWQEAFLWLSGHFDPITGGRVTMSGEHHTGELCPLDEAEGPDANCKCAEYDARLRVAMPARQVSKP